MAKEALPTFRPQDYDAFRSMPDLNLPHTYDEWLNLHREERLQCRDHGNTAVDVEINPDEFTRFCAENGTARDRKSLRVFAMKKAGL